MGEAMQTNPWPIVAAETVHQGAMGAARDQWADQYGLPPAYEVSAWATVGTEEQQIPRFLDPRLLDLGTISLGPGNDSGGEGAARYF